MDSPNPAPAPAIDTAARRAWSALARSIEREEAALEAAGFDELSASLDGEDASLDGLVGELAARDAGLSARLDGLRAFRDAAYPEIGEVVPLRRRSQPPLWLGWAAAAAALVVAVALRLAPAPQPDPAFQARTEVPGETLFADGFESGDADAWTALSPSG